MTRHATKARRAETALSVAKAGRRLRSRGRGADHFADVLDMVEAGGKTRKNRVDEKKLADESRRFAIDDRRARLSRGNLMSSFWKSELAPAWVQAGVSVLAFILAVSAYSSWKDQELARRKADLATNILRDVHAGADCLNNVRIGHSVFAPATLPDVGEFIDMVKGGTVTKLAECSVHEVALKAHAMMAARLLNTDTGTDISVLQGLFSDVRSAQNFLTVYISAHKLERLKPDAELPFSAEDKATVTPWLEKIGLRIIPSDPEARDKFWGSDDEVRKRIELWRNRVDTALQPYLHLQ